MKQNRKRLRRAALALLMTSLGALLVPVIGQAKTLPHKMVFGPLTDHGYKVQGVLTDSGASGYSLGFVFDQISGNQDQIYTLDYAKPVKLKVASNLSSASFSTSLGSAGKVSLKFKGTGALKQVNDSSSADGIDCKLPKEPTRAGTVTGTVKFDTGTVFGTIKATKLKASVASVPTGGSCKSQTLYTLQDPVPGTSDLKSLLAFNSGGDSGIIASFLRDDTPSDPFSLSGDIIETKPPSLFTHTGVSSAKVTVSGKYLSGTEKYTKTSTCDGGKASAGTITGTIKAHFLIGGVQTYGAGAGFLDKNYSSCAE